MDFFNDIFHNLALLEFYLLNIIYILLYIDFILSIFFQHSNILTRASHHWCLASNIVLVFLNDAMRYDVGYNSWNWQVLWVPRVHWINCKVIITTIIYERILLVGDILIEFRYFYPVCELLARITIMLTEVWRRHYLNELIKYNRD